VEQIRTFVAIELPDNVRAALDRLQSSLKSERQSFVRWVHPEGIHLTLKFLGNIGAAERVPQVTEAMAKACQGIMPFRLELNGVGVFPNLRSPRVVWVGLVGETERLLELQGRIEQALNPLGFPAENRPFTAHLTLGRLREGTTREERLRFGEVVASTQAEDMPSFEVDTISLMRSQLRPSGAIYSRLEFISLEKAS
jgi:2'-5' RNA ligase